MTFRAAGSMLAAGAKGAGAKGAGAKGAGAVMVACAVVFAVAGIAAEGRPAAAETPLTAHPAVSAIRAGSHPDRLRIVLDASAPVHADTRLEEDGTRLLVELPGVLWTAPDSGRFGKGVGASGWTARPTPHSVRLSIDLPRRAGMVSTALLPGMGGTGQRLVIDITRDVTALPARIEAPAAAPPSRSGSAALNRGAAAGMVVASDLSPRPSPKPPGRLPDAAPPAAGSEAAATPPILLGLPSTAAGTAAPAGFSISLGFMPSDTALRLGMAPEKPQNAPGGGNPLKGSTTTSLMGSPMDMDWGFENGSFAVKMSAPGDGDMTLTSRLRFKDRSLTLGVVMPF